MPGDVLYLPVGNIHRVCQNLKKTDCKTLKNIRNRKQHKVEVSFSHQLGSLWSLRIKSCFITSNWSQVSHRSVKQLNSSECYIQWWKLWQALVLTSPLFISWKRNDMNSLEKNEEKTQNIWGKSNLWNWSVSTEVWKHQIYQFIF